MRGGRVWILFMLVIAPAGARGQTYYDVLLTPSGYTNAKGYGISGSAEVGAAVSSSTGYTTALLWPTSTSSSVNLGPDNWTFSEANGVYGNQQVGDGTYPNGDNILSSHALLWSGTAASIVDLNPSSYNYSMAYATDGAQQVGAGEASGSYLPGALLWSGSASSAVNLNPTNYSSSIAMGVSGGIQVGYGYGSPLDRNRFPGEPTDGRFRRPQADPA